jgi:lipopolysaccharide transport system permease protein
MSTTAEAELKNLEREIASPDDAARPTRKASDLPVVVYSPESPLRHPVRLVRDMLADLWRIRELVWILFLRDLQAQYRQSYLGYFWVIAPPLATSLVWLFLNSTNVVNVAATPIPYAAFLLIGTVLWDTFASAVTTPLSAYNGGKSVFMKLKVPPEAFILKGVATVLFNLFIRLLLLIPVFVLFKIVPPATVLLLPISLAVLVLFGLSLGMLLIPVGALYTDVQRAVGLGIGFVMYTAPIVYPPPKDGLAATLVHWNPLTPVVMTTRDWMTTGASESVPYALAVGFVSLLLAFLAAVVLRITMPHLVARMGM